MELRHLRYLVAVAREGQFVRAAAELHVAQSALSQQVADLERELGVRLLHRDRRGVTPTPAGEVMLGHARAVLEQVEVARAEVVRLSGVVSGTLRVASGGPSGGVPLPAALAELRRRHPAVEITLRDAPSEQLIRWLEEGTVDIALVTFPPERLPRSVEAMLIDEERLVLLAPRGHRLDGRAGVSLRALAGESLVTFPHGSGVRAAIDAGFDAAGVGHPPITAETIDPIAMHELVAAGLGVALVPDSFAQLALAQIVTIAVHGPVLRRPLTLAWPRERRALPALDAFLEFAADWFPVARPHPRSHSPSRS